MGDLYDLSPVGSDLQKLHKLYAWFCQDPPWQIEASTYILQRNSVGMRPCVTSCSQTQLF